MSNKRQQIICGICGDKAIGRNFGAITCEPCKAFFRRTAFKTKISDCPSDGKCNINPSTRKVCQKCRINKCLALGMKRELIKNADQRQCRKIMIEGNRQKRKPSLQSDTDFSSEGQSSAESVTSETEEISDFLSEILSNSGISDEELNSQIMEIESTIHELFETNDYLNSNITQLSVVPVFKQIPDINGFNQLESHRLSELFSATNIFIEPSTKHTIEITNAPDMYKYSFSTVDIYIKKIVEFTNGLELFKDMCENDRLVLVKYGCFSLGMLRGALYYNSETEDFTSSPDSEYTIKMNMRIMKEESEIMYTTAKHFLNEFIPQWDRDSVIIDLLTAIALFNPNRPKLLHKESVKLQQQLYIYLLQRYILSGYHSQFDSNTRLSKLVYILTDLENCGEICKKTQIDKYSQYMQFYGPLQKEILDI